MTDPTGRRIRKIDRDAQRFVARALGHGELSLSDYDLIHTVRHRPGITQEDLRQLYSQDKSTIARRAARLEEMGYIRREVHPQDRRRKCLFVTGRGAALRDRKVEAEAFYFQWLVEGLPEDQLSALCEILRGLQLRSRDERRAGFAQLLDRYARERASRDG